MCFDERDECLARCNVKSKAVLTLFSRTMRSSISQSKSRSPAWEYSAPIGHHIRVEHPQGTRAQGLHRKSHPKHFGTLYLRTIGLPVAQFRAEHAVLGSPSCKISLRALSTTRWVAVLLLPSSIPSSRELVRSCLEQPVLLLLRNEIAVDRISGIASKH